MAMTVYLDLIVLLNFYIDFVLLLIVSITLKRHTSLKRLLFGSITGSISLIILFLPFSNILLNIFKLLLGLCMTLVTFGIKDKKYVIQNLTYLYMSSIILGGSLYYFKLQTQEIYILLVITSPIILLLYYKQQKEYNNYQEYYQTKITFLNNTTITLNSYLDTGNKLMDPITKKKIILVQKEKINPKNLGYPILVSYNSLNHHGILKCFKIKSLEINGIILKNYLIGISEGDLLKNGIECVLNYYCKEEII